MSRFSKFLYDIHLFVACIYCLTNALQYTDIAFINNNLNITLHVLTNCQYLNGLFGRFDQYVCSQKGYLSI